ncbi:Maltodextrin utilization protein YvdJ [Fictibacillus enclensis]|uniref:DUF1189 domain-containing protein n=1 Tax=Fictibacillus enclensis TaxID=1017270 RepID=A0A0V8JF92_9BACL|nr:DUF1189 domain-containing protein [Fictibacillus enclensis]KSU85775.1 hypothetical protein AS030_09870 [Fictibacillus enclensis]SCC02371.1 Maltodextrin utilization protein YvdJ [Fictibacillus enclensis]
MRIVNHFIKSLYSPQTVARLRFQGVGKAIGYIFFLIFLTSIPFGITFSMAFKSGTEEFEQSMKSDIPDFTLKDGKLSSQLKKPVIQTDDNQTFIFDTTGAVKESDLNKYNDVIAMLKNKAIITSGGETQAFPYQTLGDVTLTKQDVSSWINKLSDLLPILLPLIFLFIYLFTVAMKFIGVTVLAVIGLVLQNISRRSLNYRRLWVMSAYSVTLPTVFFAVMKLLHTEVPFSFIIYWAVASLFLHLSIKETPDPQA